MPKGFERVTSYPGVYCQESKTKKHQGKPAKCFYITYKDQVGKKHWEKIGFDSEGYNAQAAVLVRNERVRAMRHGDELPKKKKPEITFGEVWIEYDKWLEAGGKKFPVNDRGYYRKYLKPRFEKKALSEITPFALEQLKKELRELRIKTADRKEKKLADQTIKHILVIVRQMFNKAGKWHLWSGRNPVSDITLPSPDNARMRFLKPTEIKILFEDLTEHNPTLHDIALLGLETGMRVGEMLSLQWKRVDFENMQIEVRDTKNKRPRTVFITQPVKEMLERRKPSDNHIEDLIFMSKTGRALSNTDVCHQFKEVAERVKLNDGISDRRDLITPHSWRHTFCSRLAQAGATIQEIMELAGHRTPAMALRYSHLIPDQKRAMVNRISMLSSKVEPGDNVIEFPG